MAGSSLSDSLLLILWLVAFAKIFITSVREVIKDHFRRKRISKGLKLRGR